MKASKKMTNLSLCIKKTWLVWVYIIFLIYTSYNTSPSRDSNEKDFITLKFSTWHAELVKPRFFNGGIFTNTVKISTPTGQDYHYKAIQKDYIAQIVEKLKKKNSRLEILCYPKEHKKHDQIVQIKLNSETILPFSKAKYLAHKYRKKCYLHLYIAFSFLTLVASLLYWIHKWSEKDCPDQ